MNHVTQLHDLRQNWTPPDGLGYSSLRPVRLTGGGTAVLAAAALLSIGAVVAGVALGSQARRQSGAQRELQEKGLTTDAVVTRVWRASEEGKQPWVAYRFTSAGREYEKRVKTPRRIWKNLEAGVTIPVRFVPSNPAINHPRGWDGGRVPFWLPYLVFTSLAVLALLTTMPVRNQARLLAEGRPAPGLVTGLKKNDNAVTVMYEFRLLSGAIGKGSGSAGRRPPVQGSSICVLYDPENPRRNSLYPLGLVKLANLHAGPARLRRS